MVVARRDLNYEYEDNDESLLAIRLNPGNVGTSGASHGAGDWAMRVRITLSGVGSG